MLEPIAAVLLAGGLGTAAAFLLGLAFARSGARIVGLAAAGTLLACLYLSTVPGGADPLVRELLVAAGNANALGWLAGTTLVARVRFREWLLRLDLEEAA